MGEFRPMNKAQAKLEHLSRELASKGLTKISVAVTGGDVVTISANEMGLSSSDAAASLRAALAVLQGDIQADLDEATSLSATGTTQEPITGDEDEFGSSY